MNIKRKELIFNENSKLEESEKLFSASIPSIPFKINDPRPVVPIHQIAPLY